METSTSLLPRANPRHFYFEDGVVQIPAPTGENGVQMPDPIVGFVCQMPHLKNNCRRLVSAVVKLVYIRGTQKHKFKMHGKLLYTLATWYTVRFKNYKHILIS